MLTVPQAAQIAGRSPETIRRWVRSGKLPASKVGTQHLIDEDDLAALLQEGRVGEPAAPYVKKISAYEIHAPSDLLKRITMDPEILAGKPAVRGTRIPVELVLDVLAAGWPEDEVLYNYPTLKPDDLRACIAYAAEVVREESYFPLPTTQ